MAVFAHIRAYGRKHPTAVVQIYDHSAAATQQAQQHSVPEFIPSYHDTSRTILRYNQDLHLKQPTRHPVTKFKMDANSPVYPMPSNQALIVTMTKFSSKKTTRDPSAPKRNLSAYLLYQNSMRTIFKSENPDMSFGDLAKYTSARYAELSEGEKQYWAQKAQEDKDRYIRELSIYQPPLGFDAKGDAIDSSDKKSGKKRAAKAQRDKKAPKRNLSAYLLYQNAMRDQFKHDYPEMSFGQLSKHTSQKYNSLTKEEKYVWIQKAEEDKKRYDRELCEYIPPPGYDAYGVQILSDVDSDGNRKRNGKRGGRAEVVQFAVPGNIVMTNYGMMYPHHMDMSHTAL